MKRILNITITGTILLGMVAATVWLFAIGWRHWQGIDTAIAKEQPKLNPIGPRQLTWSDGVTRELPAIRQAFKVEIFIGPFCDEEDPDKIRTDLRITPDRIEIWKPDSGIWGGQRNWKHEPSICRHDGMGRYRCVLDEVDTDTRGECTVAVEMPGCLPVHNRFEILDALDRVFRANIELSVYNTLVSNEELESLKEGSTVVTIKGDDGGLADWWCVVPWAAEPVQKMDTYTVPAIVCDNCNLGDETHKKVLGDLWTALRGKSGKAYLERIEKHYEYKHAMEKHLLDAYMDVTTN